MTPETAAAELLVLWWREEEPLHAALKGGSRGAQRESLGRAASYFRVARSLKRSFDEELGMPRFEPLRKCMAAVTTAGASDQRFTATTMSVARAIAARYGGHSYLSLASKLLWIKFLHPFIIYDSVVRERLGTPRGDYHSYVAAWQERYAIHREAIKWACTALPRSSHSGQALPTITGAAAHAVAREEWFRRRVLDILLWHGGA